MMVTLKWVNPSATPMRTRVKGDGNGNGGGPGKGNGGFPWFLPKEVEKIKDPFAKKLAQRIERLPVKVQFLFCSQMCILVLF